MANKLTVIFGILSSIALFHQGFSKELYEDTALNLDHYALPEFNYDYDGLEPFIDERTLQVHHRGHHAAYTNKLNSALSEWKSSGEGQDLYNTPLLNIIQNQGKVPEKWKKSIQNNGGGYFNHALYFGLMSPNVDKSTRHPSGLIEKMLINSFGNFTFFKDWFDREALKLFGSGYVWLCYETEHNYLTVFSTNNQVSPVVYGLYPVLVIDLWEHSYYLKHQNKRINYIQDWWKVADWEKSNRLLLWWKSMDKHGRHNEL